MVTVNDFAKTMEEKKRDFTRKREEEAVHKPYEFAWKTNARFRMARRQRTGGAVLCRTDQAGISTSI
jgi:hypothetical protein